MTMLMSHDQFDVASDRKFCIIIIFVRGHFVISKQHVLPHVVSTPSHPFFFIYDQWCFVVVEDEVVGRLSRFQISSKIFDFSC